MKVTFFGTSHGYPEPNRKCSSALVEIGANKYIIDIGCDITTELINREIPLGDINAVFVTHMHGDHTNGLIPFLDVCSWAFTKTTDPQVFIPHDPDVVQKTINAWTLVNGVRLRDFKISKVHEGVFFDDGTLKITAFKNQHTKESYSFLLETENKRVLFSGDLCSTPEKDFPLSVLNEPLDLAVCESAHAKATAYLPILGNTKNLKKLCINHYVGSHVESIQELAANLTIPVVLSVDGLLLEI